MPPEDREWYRAEYHKREAALRRQARRKVWFVRATINVLFAVVFALAVPLLGNVATNMYPRGHFPNWRRLSRWRHMALIARCR